MLIIGTKKPWGTYPGFKFLPNKYYKDRLELPVVDAGNLNALFKRGPISGPQRLTGPKIVDI